MAHKAYVILAQYRSESSDSIYEVRRGGDGVLYCTCRGWIASKSVPRACKHCKDYVATHPGTSYGPYVTPVRPSFSPPVNENWRTKLIEERNAAVARVQQVPDALAAYARDLDL